MVYGQEWGASEPQARPRTRGRVRAPAGLRVPPVVHLEPCHWQWQGRLRLCWWWGVGLLRAPASCYSTPSSLQCGKRKRGAGKTGINKAGGPGGGGLRPCAECRLLLLTRRNAAGSLGRPRRGACVCGGGVCSVHHAAAENTGSGSASSPSLPRTRTPDPPATSKLPHAPWWPAPSC